MSPVLNLQGVNRAPIAGKLQLTHVADVISEIRLELYDPDLISVESDLAGTRSRQWFDGLNSPGQAQFTIQHDNADLALVLQKKLVTYFYREIAACTMVIESLEPTSISPEEEAGEFTVVSGRGHLALLEKALVYPTLGANNLPVEQDRHVNWTSPFYDDVYAGWGYATEVIDVGSAQAGGWGGTNWNTDFPDPTAYIIWASDGTVLSAGQGHCYFRLVINVGISVPAKAFLTADDSAQLYIDGQIVCAVDFNDLATGVFPLSAGLHMIAVQCENNDPGGFGTTPAGVAWAIYGTDEVGTLTGLIANSSSAMKIVEYAADPPGVTVGWAMGQIISEHQARGILAGMTTTFTNLADSYGEPWPLVADIGTSVGVDVLSFFIELAASGYIDFWMTPGMFELNAVVKDTRGTV